MRLYLFVMLLCAFARQCASNGCDDKHAACLYWTRKGECKRNPTFMEEFCCKSCNAAEQDLNQNIALHQPTRQSSTAWGGYSSLAVDGNSNSAYYGKSCTHTGHDSYAWWSVDLGCATKVSMVRITNRVNSWERLANFDVRLGMTPDTPTRSKICKSYHGTVPSEATIDIKCNMPTVGRYLYVMLRGKDYLTLCEVQVFSGFPKRVNLALHRPARQSSTHHSDNVASKAVDGSKQNDFTEKSCAVTKQQKNSWWSVDLGKSFDIGLIRISNRKDGWGLSNFKVLVGDVEGGPLFNSLCTYYYGKVPLGAIFELTCEKKTKGRYVFITMPEYYYMSICEVEIYSDVPKDYHGNLALYKPTMQSSTNKYFYSTYATDGILHGTKFCAWTNSEENSWWAVDLGAPKEVKMVRLTNPASPWYGLVDFDIRVNNRCGNPINSQLCIAYFGKMAFSLTRDFKCRKSVNGQYVYVLSRQKRQLGICEVEVYSTERAPGIKRNVICERK